MNNRENNRPHSYKMERFLVNAVILNSESLLDVIDILRPQMFLDTASRKTFQVFLEMFAHDEDISSDSLSQRLEELERSDNTATDTYKIDTKHNDFFTNDIQYCSHILSLYHNVNQINNGLNKLSDQLTLLDDLDQSAQDKVYTILNPIWTIVDIMDDLNRNMYYVLNNKKRPEPSSIKSIAQEVIHTIDEVGNQKT